MRDDIGECVVCTRLVSASCLDDRGVCLECAASQQPASLEEYRTLVAEVLTWALDHANLGRFAHAPTPSL